MSDTLTAQSAMLAEKNALWSLRATETSMYLAADTRGKRNTLHTQSAPRTAGETYASVATLDNAQTGIVDPPLVEWDFNDLIWHDTSTSNPAATNWLTIG